MKLFFSIIVFIPIFCFSQRDSLAPEERDSLIALLFVVDEEDQKYRNQIEFVQSSYGAESVELKNLFEQMKVADSLNLIIVRSILDNYGWLGERLIGYQANTALFMVIQHSDLSTQIHYLPMLRIAVINGNAEPHHLAMLEDRVALYDGNFQIYGTQLSWNIKTDTYFVAPLLDPYGVDQRRAAIGLPPIAIYLEEFGLVWDVEAYIQQLPELEQLFFDKK